MKIVAAVGVVLLVASTEPTPALLTYIFDEVTSKVVLEHDGESGRVNEGDTASAGDLVRTGWFGHAIISIPEQSTRFEIFSSTRARLAGREPGVLIELDRGRLKAIFDALKGSAERAVATPGAILAVRGTRFGVEVSRNGDAVLSVFEGVVELRSRAPRQAPIMVRAGEAARYGRRVPPKLSTMPGGLREDDWDHGRGFRPGETSHAPSRAPRPGGATAPGPGQKPPSAGGGHGGASP